MSPSRLILMRRRLLRRLALFLLGTVGAILLLEGALRIAGLALDKSVYPSSSSSIDKADFQLICVGDSFTKGIGSPPEFSFPKQLEGLLNHDDAKSRWAVLNLGKSGSNSSQAVDRALAFLETSPKSLQFVVFCAGTNNDHNFEGASLPPDENLNLGGWVAPKYHLTRKFAAARLLFVLIDRWRQSKPPDDSPAPASPGDENGKSPEIEYIQRWVEHDIEALYEQVHRAGARLVLVNYWFPVGHLDEVYSRVMKRHEDVLFVDVGKFGTDRSYPVLYRTYANLDWHCNEEGYGRIAHLVYQGMKTAGWLALPPKPPAPSLDPKTPPVPDGAHP